MLVKLNKKQTNFSIDEVIANNPELQTLEIMAKHPVKITLDISKAKSLTKLYLYANPNCKIIKCKDLEKLEILKIRELQDIESIYLKETGQLKVLQFARCNLKVLPTWCCHLIHLETLELQGNHLTDFPIELEWLTNLRRLNIDSNSFCEIPRVLANLQALNHLSIDGNNIKLGEYEKFKQILNSH